MVGLPLEQSVWVELTHARLIASQNNPNEQDLTKVTAPFVPGTTSIYFVQSAGWTRKCRDSSTKPRKSLFKLFPQTSICILTDFENATPIFSAYKKLFYPKLLTKPPSHTSACCYTACVYAVWEKLHESFQTLRKSNETVKTSFVVVKHGKCTYNSKYPFTTSPLIRPHRQTECIKDCLVDHLWQYNLSKRS